MAVTLDCAPIAARASVQANRAATSVCARTVFIYAALNNKTAPSNTGAALVAGSVFHCANIIIVTHRYFFDLLLPIRQVERPWHQGQGFPLNQGDVFQRCLSFHTAVTDRTDLSQLTC